MAPQQILDRDAVMAALDRVIDPDRGLSLVALGMIDGVVVQGGNVSFAITVDPQRGPKLEPLRHAAERAIQALPGVASVSAVLTAQRPQQAPPSPMAGKAPIPGVATILAVASGKGGVGKSTTSVNLALALKGMGLRVGLLDADIYGPSLPRLMGLSGKPSGAGDNKIAPMVAYGIACMSIGFMVAEDSPMIWRGPMVMGALEQMLRDVAWGELDVLVVDLPPGTGDAQLTMAQRVPVTGAVIVSTPQDIALLDARKGLNMFRKVDIPVFGIVENMSYYICPSCGHRAEIFGHGGAHQEADRLGVDFLGELPLTQVIRETSDSGKPIVVSQPDGPQAAAYRAIAARVRDKLAASRS